jgi:hypothetical protein
VNISFDPHSQRRAQARELLQRGQIAECVESLRRLLREHPGNRDDLLFAGLLIAHNGLQGHFREAIGYLEGYLESGGPETGVYVMLGYACWVAGEMGKAEVYGKEAIRLMPRNADGYRNLVMLYLTTGRAMEALGVASAGMAQAEQPQSLEAWMRLATAMTREPREVTFMFDGVRYAFELACFNSHAMEECLFHMNGTLYEAEELRYLRQAVPTVRRVVECGCLVGNHTLFFARTWRPERITGFDMALESIAQTRRNFELNARLQELPTVLDLRHAAVGAAGAELEVACKKMTSVALDEEVREPFDFLKIDVDGAEIEALRGGTECILRNRPLMMVEVSVGNRGAFMALMGAWGYRVEREFARPLDSNYFVAPGP